MGGVLRRLRLVVVLFLTRSSRTNHQVTETQSLSRLVVGRQMFSVFTGPERLSLRYCLYWVPDSVHVSPHFPSRPLLYLPISFGSSTNQGMSGVWQPSLLRMLESSEGRILSLRLLMSDCRLSQRRFLPFPALNTVGCYLRGYSDLSAGLPGFYQN